LRVGDPDDPGRVFIKTRSRLSSLRKSRSADSHMPARGRKIQKYSAPSAGIRRGTGNQEMRQPPFDAGFEPPVVIDRNPCVARETGRASYGDSDRETPLKKLPVGEHADSTGTFSATFGSMSTLSNQGPPDQPHRGGCFLTSAITCINAFPRAQAAASL